MPKKKVSKAANHFFRAEDMYIVPKAWGEEHWIVNKEYCGKKLILKKNHRCSMHQHKEKDEVFYVQSGKVMVELGGKSQVLEPGDSVHIPRNTLHRFTGLEPSEIMEFSTNHKDEDSYRTENSGHIEPKRYEEERSCIEKFSKAKILVVGDVMLDTYLEGTIDRISPEAPVPIVRYRSERAVAGGAANVAANIVTLEGTATLIGVCGKDEAGSTLKSLLKKHGVRALLQTDASRCTTQKTRIVGHGQQQMLRFDREHTHAMTSRVENALLETIKKELKNHDVLLLSDYAKGIFSPTFLKACIALGKAAKKPVLLDPKPKDATYLKLVKGASLLLPNRKEAELLVGSQKNSIKELAMTLAKNAGAAILVTAGEHGMTLIAEKEQLTLPALAHSIVDVSGAGDTVAAVIALALASHAELPMAADLANRAASIVVTKPGTATTTREELLRIL